MVLPELTSLSLKYYSPSSLIAFLALFPKGGGGLPKLRDLELVDLSREPEWTRLREDCGAFLNCLVQILPSPSFGSAQEMEMEDGLEMLTLSSLHTSQGTLIEFLKHPSLGRVDKLKVFSFESMRFPIRLFLWNPSCLSRLFLRLRLQRPTRTYPQWQILPPSPPKLQPTQLTI